MQLREMSLVFMNARSLPARLMLVTARRELPEPINPIVIEKRYETC